VNNTGGVKATSAKDNSGGEPLVAIVDDDDLMRSSTRRLLRATGMRTEAFASAEDFLSSGVVEETACLILDLRMPGMNGLQLQRLLAEASNPVPIIFLSARSTADEERQALQAGALQFLHKPVSKDVLLLALRSALETRPEDERKIP
jgi:FixJ family two-component response regulator